MGMPATQILTYIRSLATIPFPQRFTDVQLLPFISTAQCDLAMEVRKPGATLTFTTVNQANTGIIPEYRLPRFVSVRRVKLAGMLLDPTDIPSMEGAQIQLYDATASNFGPQWENQTSQPYPGGGTNQLPYGWPYPGNGMPFIAGARPVYYLREQQQIGFVPPPSGTYPVQMDVVLAPPDLVTARSESPYDSLFLDALAWRTLQKIHSANAQNPQQMNRAQVCQGNWLDAIARLRSNFNMANTGFNSSVTPLGRGTTPGAWGPGRMTGGTSGSNPFAALGVMNPDGQVIQTGTVTVPADGLGTTPTPTTVIIPLQYIGSTLPTIQVQVNFSTGNAIAAAVGSITGGSFQVVAFGGTPGSTVQVEWISTGTQVVRT